MGNNCCTVDDTEHNVDSRQIFDLDQMHPLQMDEFRAKKRMFQKSEYQDMYERDQEIFIGSELRCVLLCSPADAMVLVPDQIDPIKIIEDPDRVGLMASYVSHRIINWGENGCQYIYTLENGR